MTDSILKTALQYADLGWHVFPTHSLKDGICTCGNLGCKSAGKHPRILNWVKDATTSKDQIKFWFEKMYKNGDAGLAIATGKISGFYVIDVDSKKGGLENWQDYCDQNDYDYADSIVQKTRNNGLHIFCEYPKDKEIVTDTSNIISGVDTRGEGGYIVAYPSIGYEYLETQSPFDEDIELFKPNESTLNKIYRRDAKLNEQFTLKQEDCFIDQLEIDKIKSALPFVESMNGDYASWRKIGAALHSTGDSRSFQWWLDWSELNPLYKNSAYDGCSKEWVKFEKYGASSDGSIIDIKYLYKLAFENGWEEQHDISDCNFEPISMLEFEALKSKKEKPEKLDVPCVGSSTSIVVHNIDTLDAYNNSVPTEHWISGGFLFEGATVMIVGEPKVGKSKLFAIMAFEAALGRQFLNFSFEKPLKTLWLQAEIHHSFLKTRIQPFFENLSSEDLATVKRNFLFTGRFSLDIMTDRGLYELCTLVKDLEIDLVAIDPIANISSVDENLNRDVVKLLQRVDQLKTARCPKFKQQKTAVCIMHHMRKSPDPESPFDGIRGASAFRGYYDTGIAILKTDDKNVVNIHYELRNGDSPKSQLLRWDGNSAKQVESSFDDQQADREQQSDLKQVQDQFAMTINQAAIYLAAVEYLTAHGKTLMDELATALAKSRTAGISLTTGIQRTLDAVLKICAKHNSSNLDYESVHGVKWIFIKKQYQ